MTQQQQLANIKIAQSIANRTLKDNGCNYWFDGVERTSGFCIGEGAWGIKLKNPTREQLISSLSFALTTFRANQHKWDGIGTWVEEGTVYIDPITHKMNRNEATEIGVNRGEIAIYDITAQRSYYLPD